MVIGVDIEEYLKQIMGSQEDPVDDLEKMDVAEEMLNVISIEGAFQIPEADKEKHVLLGSKAVFYPPEKYYGKTLTSGAFVDLMKEHQLVPVSISNIHIFTTWEEARELWGYALLWKHLYETYHIIPVMEKDKDEGKE